MQKKPRIWCWVLLRLLLTVVGLLSAVLGRTFSFTSRQLKVAPVKHVALDRAAVLGRLFAAIRLRTLSQPVGPQVLFDGLAVEASGEIHASPEA